MRTFTKLALWSSLPFLLHCSPTAARLFSGQAAMAIFKDPAPDGCGLLIVRGSADANQDAVTGDFHVLKVQLTSFDDFTAGEYA